MLTWKAFRDARPDLAEAGRGLLYQFGVGLAFLGTVRRDGAPRTHPIRVILADDHLYAFIVPGPKMWDLRRDGRHALHCFPPINNEDGFHITGRAEERSDPDIREPVVTVLCRESNLSEPHSSLATHPLFEFFVDTCQLTRTTGHGDFDPKHTIWKASVEAR
jgi:hypothetical protein